MSERYPWDAYGPDTVPDMGYLLSDGGQARAVLAAHHIRDCPHVVEIGGYKTPITKFLTRVPQSVLVVDPKVDRFSSTMLYGKPCRVNHIAARFQDVEFDLEAGSYGLVLLGCSLKFRGDSADSQWRKLFGLIENARLTVLEYGIDWQRGCDNVARILRATDISVRTTIDLDLRRNADIDTAYGARRLMVLVPGRAA